jgi:hypothetical protein
MGTIEHVQPVEVSKVLPWQKYLLDTLLAFVGAMLVTGVIYVFQLYPGIHNISITYLLVILALASTRVRSLASRLGPSPLIWPGDEFPCKGTTSR